MNPSISRYGLLFYFVIIQHISFGQVKKKIRQFDRNFQVSLFPGISTNGIHSGSYFNKFSLNIFGGLSAGNQILEVGAITNVNIKSATGIQLAGLANIVGTNAFINLSETEEKTLIITDDFESNSKGIQIAGFLNYVRNHSTGIQLAGIFNVVGGDLKGVQIAGIGNSSGNGTNGYSAGLQLAGLYNISKEAIGGFQVSGLFNYTDGQLSGAQLGLINKARIIKGKHTLPPTKAKGLQVGLVNFSKEMDGTQIGLVNFGGTSLGKQFGLINFFSKYPTKERTDKNTPVGLLNFGSRGTVKRIFYNELFATNLEYTTGSCYNCSVTQSEMPFEGRNQIFNQNALILGYDPFQDTWGFGYGFQKILYNKSSMLPSDPGNRKWLKSYGIKFLHLNRTMSFDKSFNLVNRVNFDFGKRRGSMYLFVGASLNYFVHEAQDDYQIKSIKISTGEIFNLTSELWPGYSLGVQF